MMRFRFAVALALAAVGVSYAAGPQLSASFTVTDARPSGDSVHLTFAFSLHSGQPSDLVVEAIKVGNPSASDRPYHSFHGGKIPAGGALEDKASFSVPKEAFEKWKAGEPAAMFVRTAGDTGGPVWTRVDAHAAAPIH